MTISRQDVFHASLILAFFGILRLLLGLWSQLVIAGKFGISASTDAYFVAFSIPQIFGDYLVGGVLFYVMMPVVMEYRVRKGEKEAMEVVSVFFTLSAVLLVTASVVYFVCTSPIIKILAPYFPEDVHHGATQLAMILSPLFVLLGLALLCSSLLQAHHHFLSSAVSGVCVPLGVIISCMLFSTRFGIASVAWGALVGAVCQLAIQARTLLRAGILPCWSLKMDHPAVRRASSLFCLLALTVVAWNTSGVVQRMLASDKEGVISCLAFAQTVSRLPMFLLAVPLITAVFPKLALHVANGAQEDVVNTFNRSLRMIHFLLIPVVGLVIVFSRPIVEILFKRGAFSDEAVQWTSEALTVLSFGIIALAQQQLLSRALFAIQRLGVLLVSSVVCATISIPANIYFYGQWDIRGLAAVTSLLLYAQTGFLFWYVSRTFKHAGKVGGGEGLITMGAATVGAIVVAKGMFGLLVRGNPVGNMLGAATALGFAMLCGVIVYGTMCLVMKLDEMKHLVDVVREASFAWWWRVRTHG